MYNIPHPGMILYIPLLPFDDPLPDFYQAENRRKNIFEPVHEISNNVVLLVYATSKASEQPAHTRSLIRAFASRLSIL